jgi:murein DD-endopeptidase MepM/ murein hydrolase activator NlpD
LSVGVSGIVKNTVLAKNLEMPKAQMQLAATQPQELDIVEKAPVPVPEDYSAGSGGPESTAPSAPEDAEVAIQITAIRKKADPAFLPTMWAHMGKINNEFGFRRNPFGGRAYEFHPGMDINGERGDFVVAPANGTVIKAGWTGGYGNMIEIDHGNGLATRYGHLSKIQVEVGDSITRGQIIALIGSTGRSTGPHLHFELRLNDKAINPRFLLPPEPTDLTKIAG